jgi:hypothetical protein
LHLAFGNLNNETLVKLFDELKELKSILGQDFFNKLIFNFSKDNSNGVFLVRYAKSKELCDEETLKKWFLLDSTEELANFLFSFTKNRRNDFDVIKIIKWIHREIGKEFLVEVISKKVDYGRSFLHYFSRYKSRDQLFLILKFLKHEVKLEDAKFFHEILVGEDEYGESVFSNFFAEPEDKEYEFFELILNDLNLDKNLLKNI